MKNTVITFTTDDNKKGNIYKRTLIIVSIAQLFSGAGLAAGITVGALLADELLNSGVFAGVPVFTLTVGSAIAAYLIGRSSNRWGRRIGLTLGFLVGGIGSIGVIVATTIDSIVLLFISLFLYGSGMATNLQARYAGTDLARKKQRATAISIAMVATTFGVVAGPNLLEVMGKVAISLNLPVLSGVFILSAVSFLIASVIIFIFLRPDPLLVSRAIQQFEANNPALNFESKTVSVENRKGIALGTIILLLNQMVMVAIMTMTPIHMEHHGHQLNHIGLVLGVHLGSMYLPSIFSGVIIDKLGRVKMAITSGVILILAALITAFSPGDSLALILVGLSLLGLGWNFGLVSGTALLVDSTVPSTRAKRQGVIDVFIALAGASGGMISGVVVATYSYSVLSLAGVALSLVLIPIMLWSKKST